MTVERAERMLYETEMELEERRSRRRGRQRSGWRHPPQCEGCRRLLSGHNQTCPGCGFSPGGYPR